MNPDHDLPTPRLVRPIEWEHVTHEEHGDVVRVRSRRTGARVHQPPWTGAVLEGLEAGEGVEDLVSRVHTLHPDRFTRDRVRSAVGDLVFTLYLEGFVELPYEVPRDPLVDRYEVVGELGRGAVGVVWRCRDLHDDTEVAVKQGWDYFLSPEAANENLRREARVLDILDHPGVPSLRTTFDAGGRLHIVRDVVEGDPLEGPRLPRDEVARVGAHVADVLAHLHERGHLLLDVTPANFLRLPDGVSLIDPGHARALEEGEVHLEAPVGSPGFRAPEVREEQRAFPATDVDGLGRLVFTLATGRRPGREWGCGELRDRLEEGTLSAVVGSCCRRDPRERPSLQEARAHLLRGLP